MSAILNRFIIISRDSGKHFFMNAKRYFFFIAIVLAHLNLNAQSTWTLQQCIQRALDYNISIKQSSLSNEINKASVDQSTASLFPSLNGNASQNYYYGRSIDPYTNTFTTQQVRSNSFSLSSSVAIFEGFIIQNTLKQSKLNYLASQNDLKKINNDVSLNVVNYYLQVLYNQELLKTTSDQLDATHVQRDRIKRMYELGSVNKGNFLDLESQLASDEVRLVQAQAQYDASLLSLTQLLELDSVQNFSIAQPDILVPEIDVAKFNILAIYTKALSNQPEIKSSEFKLASAEKGIAIARGGYSPRIYGSGSLSTNYSNSSQSLVTYVYGPPNSIVSGYTQSGETVYTVTPNVTPVFKETPFKDQLDNNLGKSIGLSLQLPIFNGLSTRTNVKRAKLNYEITKLNHELNKKNLYKSVQQAVNDASSSLKKYEAGKHSVDALNETLSYNQQRIDLGLISGYDYLIAKNNLAKAQVDLLQAKYDYIFRLKIIDFYLGTPLAF